MYTVKTVSKSSGVSIKTLHYYHEIGLLIPEKISISGYRLYGQKNLERLQEILFYKELDFSLKKIKELLDTEIDRENILLKQKDLLSWKIQRFNKLIRTINESINSEKEEVSLDMGNLFEGFETKEEWGEVLEDQKEYLKQNYNFEMDVKDIDVSSMNDLASEAEMFNKDMVSFLKDGISSNDSKIFNRVEEHLSFLKKHSKPATAEDFLNQTEFFLSDDFHKEMLENRQIGYSYFLNRVAIDYLKNIS